MSLGINNNNKKKTIMKLQPSPKTKIKKIKCQG